jgi:hypothetical protein
MSEAIPGLDSSPLVSLQILYDGFGATNIYGEFLGC